MTHTTFTICCGVLTVLVVAIAMTTDLRWRRIPNFLTFPALAVAIVVRVIFQGWAGLGFALAGAVLAPVLLWALHAGKRIGMGDLKLAAAIGATVGPVLAIVSMLISAVVGGFLGLVWMLKPGGLLARLIDTFLIGTPFERKQREEVSAVAETMPYGVAIGMGSLITLGVCWWTGQSWIL